MRRRGAIAAAGVLGAAFACYGPDISIGVDKSGTGADGGDAGGLIPFCPPCSPDLSSEIDCNGKVITTCPDDLGCSAARRCVAACDAASSNPTNVGCDFFAVTPDVFPDIAPSGGCFAALVTNAWRSSLVVTAEYGGTPVDVSQSTYRFVRTTPGVAYEPTFGEVAPGDAVVVFLSQSPAASYACPAGVHVALASNTAVRGTARGSAIRLRTTRPAAIASVYPWGGAVAQVPSAALLLPTSTWDRLVMGVTGWSLTQFKVPPGPVTSRASALAIVGLDPTSVTVLPVQDVLGGPGLASVARGSSGRYSLGAGELIQLEQGMPQGHDLSGTVLVGDTPIAVWGTHQCMNIPSTVGGCDGAHFQVPPLRALGQTYVAARPPNRGTQDEKPPWRIVAAIEGTQLTFDPPQVGAPSAPLHAGQVAFLDASGPFVVRSQDLRHPFFVSAHMTGANSPDVLQQAGDPESVPVVPTQQWQRGYTFAIEPTFATSTLVVVRARGQNGGFVDVELDCSGPLAFTTLVGSSGEFESARVDLQRLSAPAGACDFSGAHRLRSDGAFTATVWGTDTCDGKQPPCGSVSYAFPVGMGVAPVADVVFNPPVPK